MGCYALLQGIFPTQGWKLGLSHPSEPPGKLKNTGVGGLSLLQGNFLTQESNRGHLHCRRILYQLSHQGSPKSLHHMSERKGIHSFPTRRSSDLAMRETWVPSLGWEDPLEEEMATHSIILAWRIPRTEEPDRPQSMGLQTL